MARNIIKLAGGSFEHLKNLTGTDVLRAREVVLTTDTHELFAGTGDGNYELLCGCMMGDGSDLPLIDPQKGRLYYDTTTGILKVALGDRWVKTGYSLAPQSGLVINENTGEIKVKTDNKSIIINDNDELEVNDTDYGRF